MYFMTRVLRIHLVFLVSRCMGLGKIHHPTQSVICLLYDDSVPPFGSLLFSVLFLGGGPAHSFEGQNVEATHFITIGSCVVENTLKPSTW